MFGRAKPLRVEKRWIRFERGRVLHLCLVEIFVEGPSGVSFTHGVGKCGKKGQPVTDPPGSKKRFWCARCNP